jgi:hypothetical protein
VCQLVSGIVASDRGVPVYTPKKDGTVVSNRGAVGQANLRLQTAERFFEAHPEVRPWMLPQFFEVWDDGKPALRWQWVLGLGEHVRGTKGGKHSDYVLIDLYQHLLQTKTLDARRVSLVE